MPKQIVVTMVRTCENNTNSSELAHYAFGLHFISKSWHATCLIFVRTKYKTLHCFKLYPLSRGCLNFFHSWFNGLPPLTFALRRRLMHSARFHITMIIAYWWWLMLRYCACRLIIGGVFRITAALFGYSSGICS